MKFSLPILTIILLASGLHAVGQPPAHLRQQNVPGQPLIESAAHVLLKHPPLEAKIRQTTNMFGRQLRGPGTYAQFGGGSGKVRLELKVSVAGQVASFQQICDGRFLYTQEILPVRRRLTFIDLERVRRAEGLDGSNSFNNWLALGGLPNLLRQLNENFQFGPARPGLLGNPQVPVWSLEGRWKPDRLAQLLARYGKEVDGAATAPLDQLPPQLPHRVAVTLGRDDVIPLFPYRLVFLRQTENQKTARQAARQYESILTLELFSVRYRHDMDPAEFDYVPDDQDLVDQTDVFLQQLRLAASKKSPPESARNSLRPIELPDIKR